MAQRERQLTAADQQALDNAAASAALEGQEIPEVDRSLAAAYLAGDIDYETYRRAVRAVIVDGLNLDAGPAA